MTKAEAVSFMQLKSELEREMDRFKDTETRESILKQIKANEPLFIKAQKVIARYNK